MRSDTGQPIRLSDYRVPDYLIDHVHLTFHLHRTSTCVTAQLHMRPNPKGRALAPLVLDGDELTLISLRLDDAACPDAVISPDDVTLPSPPQRPFVLTIETAINPSANTQLMGLFRSGAAYCTQCEAEGFRRITYFLDRPDVMSIYTTRIEADLSDAPILLGNGNCIESGILNDGARHYAVWHDPFPKPSYLFALVAGDLEKIEDQFITASGRHVHLAIYVEHGKGARAHYAMDALKRSMRWDEQVFEREYDLDIFNIVAVSDFNMGAMENKSLNVFNDKYVLASAETATDADYANIEAVIAHEYFHNWTGNRITCRDWFQLCLKEGLTVFRDQEFSSDQRSRPVKRINDVRNLRATQFVEDAGPLAHNVRPTIYHEINNFYTSTIYEKGAEIIRMLKTLIGADHFAAGMDLYFNRFDGTAATIEDFIACFAEASGRDLHQFMRWYEQAGTPQVYMKGTWDDTRHTYTLTCTQHTAPTPQQDVKLPFVIPIALGLLTADGTPIKLMPHEDKHTSQEYERGVFELSEPERTITFAHVTQRPILSAFRGFSAPVNVHTEQSSEDMVCLLAHDNDPFNRWQAAQNYALSLLRRLTDDVRSKRELKADPSFIHALSHVLKDGLKDPAFTSLVLTLPSEGDVARDLAHDVDPEAIHYARHYLRAYIGTSLKGELSELYHALNGHQTYSPDAAQAGQRMLKNTALDLLTAGDKEAGSILAQQQYEHAHNMTDLFAALSTLTLNESPSSRAALEDFYLRFKDDHLVLDKWFALQASFPSYSTLTRVKDLLAQHAKIMTNPNRLRSLIGTFSLSNPMAFNAPDGSGYRLLIEIVREVDERNPQIAARLLSAFRSWRSLETLRANAARTALESLAAEVNLSKDVRDIITRALQ